MFINKFILALCVLTLASMTAQAAEVYKWKDSDGNIRYSDIPPAGRTPYEIISGKKDAAAAHDAGAPAPAAKPAESTADKEIDARKRQAEADKAQKKMQEKHDEQKMREQNCNTAKSNLQNYKQGGRLYRMEDNGERHYLDDKDFADGLAKSNQEVEQWCGGQ
jgi:hypothetical protein